MHPWCCFYQTEHTLLVTKEINAPLLVAGERGGDYGKDGGVAAVWRLGDGGDEDGCEVCRLWWRRKWPKSGRMVGDDAGNGRRGIVCVLGL
ncbi:hypothetical protein Tco_1151383 [Tanacetum coccineum]